jgi:hypothetical protein
MFSQSAVQQPKNTGNSNAPKTDFGAVPQGQHVGRIVRLVGYGLQELANKFNPDKEPAVVMQVTVELPFETIEVTDKEGNTSEKPRWIWSNDIPVKFTYDSDRGVVAAHTKSKLHELLCAAFPGEKVWTPEKAQEYIGKLLTAQVGVIVTHSVSKTNGKTYDKLYQFLPVMKGITVPELQNETLLYNPYEHDEEVFQKLPQHSRDRVQKRLDKQDGNTSSPAPAPKAKQPEPPVADEDYDDDVPF